MTARIRATDFFLLKHCSRQVYLDRHGDESLYQQVGGYAAFVARSGNEFEQQVIDQYEVVKAGKVSDDPDDRFRLTVEYMSQGVPAIYQGVLINGDLIGIPDLLVRAPGPSRFGAYHYRPLDIKISQKVKDEHRLQMMAYITLLEAVQGVRPDGAVLLRLPPEEQTNGRFYREEVVEFDAQLFAEQLYRVRHLVAGEEPRPFICSICSECGWQGVCRPLAEASQDASLIPGLTRKVWEQLHERGMGTLAAVAGAAPELLANLKGVQSKTAQRLIQRAGALHTGQVIRMAPPPIQRTKSCVVFDIESLPSENLYYLMGTTIRCGAEDRFEYDLALSVEEEPRMWESFLRRMAVLDGPVYHFGDYERASVKKLIERYGEDPRALDLLNRLVDLRKIIEDCIALPLQSYSLKEVARWLGFEWTGVTQGGGDSMLDYIHWLEDGDPAHLENILRYNEDDCSATACVYDWLLSHLD